MCVVGWKTRCATCVCDDGRPCTVPITYVGFHAKRDLRAYFFKFAFLAAIATSVRNVALDQKTAFCVHPSARYCKCY